MAGKGKLNKRIKKSTNKPPPKKSVPEDADAPPDDVQPRDHGQCCLPVGIEEHVTCLMPETPLSWDGLDGEEVVKMVCDSARCTRPHHLTHAACFNKLEAFGVAQLKGKKGRAREWSDAERKRYLWQDRAYELIQKSFKCPCGHGYLRKDQNFGKGDNVPPVAAPAPPPQPDGDKKKKTLPKLNVTPGVASQKSVGSFFKDSQHCHENMSLKPPRPKIVEETDVETKRSIPGLVTKDQKKPQKLNIDLSSMKSTSNFPELPTAQSSQKSSLDESPMNDPVQNALNSIFESDDEDLLPNSYQLLDFGRVTSPVRAVKSPYPSSYLQETPAENIPYVVKRNVDLLQENVGLKEQNQLKQEMIDQMKQTIVNGKAENTKLRQMITDNRTAFNVAIAEKKGDILKKEDQIKKLWDLFLVEKGTCSFLRDLVLSDAHSVNLEEDEEVRSDQLGTSVDDEAGDQDVAEDFSDSGVSESDVTEVNQKLDELGSTARILASSQSKTEDKILCLDHKVQVLSEENKRFKEDIGKLRNYLKFFDLF